MSKNFHERNFSYNSKKRKIFVPTKNFILTKRNALCGANFVKKKSKIRLPHSTSHSMGTISKEIFQQWEERVLRWIAQQMAPNWWGTMVRKSQSPITRYTSPSPRSPSMFTNWRTIPKRKKRHFLFLLRDCFAFYLARINEKSWCIQSSTSFV